MRVRRPRERTLHVFVRCKPLARQGNLGAVCAVGMIVCSEVRMFHSARANSNPALSLGRGAGTQ